MKQLFRYRNAPKYWKIQLGEPVTGQDLTIYTDADYAGAHAMKSTYSICLHARWSNGMLAIDEVTNDGAIDIIWLRGLLEELGKASSRPNCVFGDNMFTIVTVTDPSGPNKAMHLFSVHCLVHSWARDRLNEHPWWQKLFGRLAIYLLVKSIVLENRSSAREFHIKLLPHINASRASFTVYRLDRRMTSKQLCNLKEKFGFIYFDAGILKEAEALQFQMLAAREKLLGQELPDTLRTMGHLALVFGEQERFNKAEYLQLQMVEAKRKLNGKHWDPTVIFDIHNLAATFQKLGRLEEAEELQVAGYELMKDFMGEEDPITLTYRNNLAVTLKNQGRLDKARQHQEQVLESRKKMLGESHPDTLRSMNNLATTLHFQGCSNEAQELLVPMLKMMEEVLGERHPDVLRSMGSLAALYRNQGMLDEALEQFQRILDLDVDGDISGIKATEKIEEIEAIRLERSNSGR